MANDQARQRLLRVARNNENNREVLCGRMEVMTLVRPPFCVRRSGLPGGRRNYVVKWLYHSFFGKVSQVRLNGLAPIKELFLGARFAHDLTPL